MNEATRAKQLQHTMKSVLEVDGAIGVVQTIEPMPGGAGNVVTTRWFGNEDQTLRQDQCVLIDKMPVVGADASQP